LYWKWLVGCTYHICDQVLDKLSNHMIIGILLCQFYFEDLLSFYAHTDLVCFSIVTCKNDLLPLLNDLQFYVDIDYTWKSL